ncbi:hypothetical protein SAMN05660649_01994 [Desulfotomaculum arcticum]|uniref:Uncharacterized protein n=1 Tax=Desulfotruncus arcticus DSM 17038 TaxID=1121424 RepID=A0A1I2T0V9_9FIRM|nr:hypothetical protein SAMN05660649_01994 [Desulfotomaculum arcticum] [Desulfotruncus arcticus DSM 17038]
MNFIPLAFYTRRSRINNIHIFYYKYVNYNKEDLVQVEFLTPSEP